MVRCASSKRIILFRCICFSKLAWNMRTCLESTWQEKLQRSVALLVGTAAMFFNPLTLGCSCFPRRSPASPLPSQTARNRNRNRVYAYTSKQWFLFLCISDIMYEDREAREGTILLTFQRRLKRLRVSRVGRNFRR